MPERAADWTSLSGRSFDVAVIGGGITGAGVALLSARAGLRTLLLEGRDFAWGTSGRSSKLVHGGLRYLQHLQWRTTRECSRERERLMREVPGLVDPLGFLLPVYEGETSRRLAVAAGLRVFDRLVGVRRHAFHSAEALAMLVPHVRREGLAGGFSYLDASTDDARLTLRTIQAARAHGATALNHVRVTELDLRGGTVRGLHLTDVETGASTRVNADVVVNAAGPGLDAIRATIGGVRMMRPLRGSHLVFPASRFPLAQGVAFVHPTDGRSIVACPWLGQVMVGTTDLDDSSPAVEPRITPQEAAYLMRGVTHAFPSLDLDPGDVTATWAGVRPVMSSGHGDPSRESRDSVVLHERGLITATGKLTTFLATARDVMRLIESRLGIPLRVERGPVFAQEPPDDLPSVLPPDVRRRLSGWYGQEARDVVSAAPDELECIPGTPYLWAEVRHAARSQDVLHLDDLLLRRVRLGLLLPEGGAAHLRRLREIAQPELDWSDQRWQAEETAYLALCGHAYALPPREELSDWRPPARMAGRRP